MDPNVTLGRLWAAIHETDITAAREAADDLDDWIRMGGWVPNGYSAAIDALGQLERDLDDVLVDIDELLSHNGNI